MTNYALLREAQLLAQVQTPGVVSVFDVGQFEDGAVGIVMPIFLTNEPLHVLSWRVVLDGVLQLAEGLSALHEFRILHRDIKPENIVYDDHEARPGSVPPWRLAISQAIAKPSPVPGCWLARSRAPRKNG